MKSKKLEKLGVPDKILKIFKQTEVCNVRKGRLGVRIIYFRNSNISGIYLKLGKDRLSIKELENEQKILSLLNGKLRVPNVIASDFSNNTFCIALSEVCGTPAQNYPKDDTNLIKAIGRELQKIQNLSVPPDIVPIGIDEELDDINKCLKNDEIDRKAFFKGNGKNPEIAFESLLKEKKEHQTNMFTHGDFCLPNIIMDRNDVGIIDWGKAGRGDIFRDISALEGSLRRNFGESSVKIFFEIMGIKESDTVKAKIQFYKKVDQFFYHRIKS